MGGYLRVAEFLEGNSATRSLVYPACRGEDCEGKLKHEKKKILEHDLAKK